jgi:DNA topoisomerase-6 subunit A
VKQVKNPAKNKLEDVGKKLLSDIKKGENPNLDIPVRALSNIKFDPQAKILRMGSAKAKRFFFNLAHIRKFVQTTSVASVSKELLEVGKHLNLREVFYAIKRTLPGTNINIVDEQPETDSAIADLELITGLSREQLNINAGKNGFAAGRIVIKDKNDIIDWSKMGSGGWAIPSNVEEIEFKKVDAKFVIYLEKEATWERLNEDKVWDKLNCVIIASKGQATRGIRRLLQRLSTEQKLPIYVLTDFDPWGFYIYSVIKYGSISLANISEELTIRNAKFLGLMAEDIAKYDLKRHIIKFKEVDDKRLQQMKEYEWFKEDKGWQKQFQQMAQMKGKVELAALTSRGITFISDRYIPEKLKNKDWID